MFNHLAPDEPNDEPYEVVVAAVPEVLTQWIARAIEHHPHLTLSAVAGDSVSLLQAVTHSTDVLLLGAPEVFPPPGIVSHLLAEYASLRVLVFSPQHNTSMAYWLQLRREPIPTSDAQSVVANLAWLCQRDSLSME